MPTAEFMTERQKLNLLENLFTPKEANRPTEIPSLARFGDDYFRGRYPGQGILLLGYDYSPIDRVVFPLNNIPAASEMGTFSVRYKPSLGGFGLKLGFSQAFWLVENQDGVPGFMDLVGKFSLIFPATIAPATNYNWKFPCLGEAMDPELGGWRWRLGWVSVDELTPAYRVACGLPIAGR